MSCYSKIFPNRINCPFKIDNGTSYWESINSSQNNYYAYTYLLHDAISHSNPKHKQTNGLVEIEDLISEQIKRRLDILNVIHCRFDLLPPVYYLRKTAMDTAYRGFRSGRFWKGGYRIHSLSLRRLILRSIR